MAQKNWSKAISDWNMVLQADSTQSKALGERGKCYAASGNLEKGRQDFTAALRLEPLNPTFYIGRSEISEKLGDLDSAKADLEEAKRVGYRN